MRPLQLWLSNLTGTLALPEVQYNSSPEVIRLAVMMHIRYPLSLRQIEDLLFERGIDICHETVRFWWSRFGPVFAAEIRKRRVHHTISGAPWITRARCLRFFATKRRDRRAELKLLKRTMKRYGQAKAIVTDRLRSYRAAMKVIGIVERQECGRWLNNRAENSVSTKRACDGEVQGHKDPAAGTSSSRTAPTRKRSRSNSPLAFDAPSTKPIGLCYDYWARNLIGGRNGEVCQTGASPCGVSHHGLSQIGGDDNASAKYRCRFWDRPSMATG